MADITSLSSFLEDVADAIRSKTGKTEALSAENFDTEIASISSGTVTDPLMIKTNIVAEEEEYVTASSSPMTEAVLIPVEGTVHVSVDKETLAENIGLTADKILAGERVLDIDGTAESGTSVNGAIEVVAYANENLIKGDTCELVPISGDYSGEAVRTMPTTIKTQISSVAVNSTFHPQIYQNGKYAVVFGSDKYAYPFYWNGTEYVQMKIDGVYSYMPDQSTSTGTSVDMWTLNATFDDDKLYVVEPINHNDQDISIYRADFDNMNFVPLHKNITIPEPTNYFQCFSNIIVHNDNIWLTGMYYSSYASTWSQNGTTCQYKYDESAGTVSFVQYVSNGLSGTFSLSKLRCVFDLVVDGTDDVYLYFYSTSLNSGIIRKMSMNTAGTYQFIGNAITLSDATPETFIMSKSGSSPYWSLTSTLRTPSFLFGNNAEYFIYITSSGTFRHYSLDTENMIATEVMPEFDDGLTVNQITRMVIAKTSNLLFVQSEDFTDINMYEYTGNGLYKFVGTTGILSPSVGTSNLPYIRPYDYLNAKLTPYLIGTDVVIYRIGIAVGDFEFYANKTRNTLNSEAANYGIALEDINASEIGRVSKILSGTPIIINNQDKTVIPMTEEQFVVADAGYTGLGTVTVNPVTNEIDNNIAPENIKKDVTILGITGTLEAGAGGSGDVMLFPSKDALNAYVEPPIGSLAVVYGEQNEKLVYNGYYHSVPAYDDNYFLLMDVNDMAYDATNNKLTYTLPEEPEYIERAILESASQALYDKLGNFNRACFKYFKTVSGKHYLCYIVESDGSYWDHFSGVVYNDNTHTLTGVTLWAGYVEGPSLKCVEFDPITGTLGSTKTVSPTLTSDGSDYIFSIDVATMPFNAVRNGADESSYKSWFNYDKTYSISVDVIAATNTGLTFSPGIEPYREYGVWEEITNNQDITITENGTYVADEAYLGLGTVIVDVKASDGSKGTAKVFESIDDMNANTENKDGTLGVVYHGSVTNLQVTDSVREIMFPATVVLPEAIESSSYCMFRGMSDTEYVDVQVQLSSTRFRLDAYNSEGSMRVTYSSSDGITYTRTDTGAETIDFGVPLTCDYPEEWLDAFGYFMQISSVAFDGLYQFTENTWQVAPNQFTVASPNQILPGKTAYGKTGVITGDNTMYDNIDKSGYLSNLCNLSATDGTKQYSIHSTLKSTLTPNKLYGCNPTDVSGANITIARHDVLTNLGAESNSSPSTYNLNGMDYVTDDDNGNVYYIRYSGTTIIIYRVDENDVFNRFEFSAVSLSGYMTAAAKNNVVYIISHSSGSMKIISCNLSTNVSSTLYTGTINSGPYNDIRCKVNSAGTYLYIFHAETYSQDALLSSCKFYIKRLTISSKSLSTLNSYSGVKPDKMSVTEDGRYVIMSNYEGTTAYLFDMDSGTNKKLSYTFPTRLFSVLPFDGTYIYTMLKSTLYKLNVSSSTVTTETVSDTVIPSITKTQYIGGKWYAAYLDTLYEIKITDKTSTPLTLKYYLTSYSVDKDGTSATFSTSDLDYVYKVVHTDESIHLYQGSVSSSGKGLLKTVITNVDMGTIDLLNMPKMIITGGTSNYYPIVLLDTIN